MFRIRSQGNSPAARLQYATKSAACLTHAVRLRPPQERREAVPDRRREHAGDTSGASFDERSLSRQTAPEAASRMQQDDRLICLVAAARRGRELPVGAVAPQDDRGPPLARTRGGWPGQQEFCADRSQPAGDPTRRVAGVALPHRSGHRRLSSVGPCTAVPSRRHRRRPRGLNLAITWSSRGEKYREGEIEQKWRSFKPGAGNGVAAIANLAREAGADLAAISRKHAAAAGSSVVAVRSARVVCHPRPLRRGRARRRGRRRERRGTKALSHPGSAKAISRKAAQVRPRVPRARATMSSRAPPVTRSNEGSRTSARR